MGIIRFKYYIRVLSSMSEHIRKFADYSRDAIKRAGGFSVLENIDSIVLAGSGTGLSASLLLKSYLGETRRVSVAKDFDIPFGDKKTLVLVFSYSGNDAEALASYRAAVKRGCRIVGITSGGELKKSMERNVKEMILLPLGIPDTASLPYLFFTGLKVLENSGLLPSQDSMIKAVLHDLQTPYQNTAQQFSDNLTGKTILLYASPGFKAVAWRWKQVFNTIAKVPAFVSDAGMAELSGFGNIQANFHAIILRDAGDMTDASKKLDMLRQGFRQMNISSTEIVVRKNDELTKLISAVYLGDWIAYSLSQKYSK
jgi:glucose/mannose-6-phosphate isomerase